MKGPVIIPILRRFGAQDLQIRVGNGRLAGDVGLIDAFENNIAAISSNPMLLDSNELEAARIDTQGDNQNRATFFWRRQQNPQELYTVQLSGRGTRLIALQDNADWDGQITEIGIIFYNDEDKSVEFHSLDLLPSTLGLQLAKISTDWSEFSTWSQKSVHWLPARSVATNASLPIVLGGWVLIALFLATVMPSTMVTTIAGRSPRNAQAGILITCILAWMVLDVHWTANQGVLARQTLTDYSLASSSPLTFGDDSVTAGSVTHSKSSLSDSSSHLVIMAEDPEMRFQMLRTKYHALPLPAYVHEQELRSLPKQVVGDTLVLRSQYYAPEQTPADSQLWASQLSKRVGSPAEVVWDDSQGFLIRLGEAAEREQ